MFITRETHQTSTDWTSAVVSHPPSSLWPNSYNYVEAQTEKQPSDECVMKVTTYSTS